MPSASSSSAATTSAGRASAPAPIAGRSWAPAGRRASATGIAPARRRSCRSRTAAAPRAADPPLARRRHDAGLRRRQGLRVRVLPRAAAARRAGRGRRRRHRSTGRWSSTWSAGRAIASPRPRRNGRRCSSTDTRVAWTGTVPALGDTPLRLEAAAFAGKIVYVQTDRAVDAGRPRRLASAGRRRSGTCAPSRPSIVGLLFVGSALLARRNVIAGRGDHRSAWRLALVVGALDVLRWLFVAHYSGDYATDQGELLDAVAEALLDAGLVLAGLPGHRALAAAPLADQPDLVEPAARRRPSRSARRPGPPDRRRLRRRHRDLRRRCRATSSRSITGQPPGPMFNGVRLLTSLRWVVAGVLGSASNALVNGVLLSMLYVVLRQLLRSRAAGGDPVDGHPRAADFIGRLAARHVARLRHRAGDGGADAPAAPPLRPAAVHRVVAGPTRSCSRTC